MRFKLLGVNLAFYRRGILGSWKDVGKEES